MIAIAFLFFSIFASPLALSAPTLDASTLLQNGQAAQQLNAEFQTLKVTDACNTGDTACISGLSAECSNGAWQTQTCPGGDRECFAVPSVTSNGTFLACTSEANALSLIGATGAEGGLTSNITSNGTDTSTSSSDNGNSTSSNSTNGGSTATVTVFLTPGATVMLPPTTRTISPAEASRLVSKLTGGDMGSFHMTATPSCTSSTSSSSTSAPIGDNSPSISASPSGNLSSNADPNSAVGNPIILTGSHSPVTTSLSTTPTASSANSGYYRN